MASLRQQILDYIVTALNTNRTAGIPVAVKSYSSAIDLALLPNINVCYTRDEAEPHAPPGLTITRRRLTVAIECRAAGNGTTPGEAMTDALVSWVVGVLGALEPVAGLFSVVTEETTEPERDTTDLPYCLETVTFVVQYQTKSNSLSSSTWP